MKYINILIKNILKLNRQYILIVSIFIFIILIPDTANAFPGLAKFVDSTLGAAAANMFGALKEIFAQILKLAVMPLVTNVMSYQNFFSNGVNAGWTITRNFANLFFALILLIIAIATVLNVGALSNYTAKRMLPTFIFVALFINFSKAIVGFLIDISQIIMISLYNSFGPNLANTITQASKFAEASADSQTNVLVLNVFIIVLLLVLIGTLLWTALILAMRIVTLWFVIMLSPLAFVSYLVPGLNSINNDWRNKLQEALITGPTLMFLLYLAMTLMNAGLSTNLNNSGNLIQNGNLINYVLVIGLLFLANSTATKAGQAAPPMLQKAVGVATTAATFGLGAYVGAGGYGTKQFADTSLGGLTRGVQVLTGGKIKANSRYESIKRDMKAANDAGKGLFRGVGQQFSKEGREEQQKDFELQQARAYEKSGKIDDPDKKRYKKILTASMAEVASEIKDATNAAELGKMYLKALKDGEVEAAAQIAAKISTLDNGWDIAMTDKDNRENPIFKEALKKGSRSEQMKYIWEQSFGSIKPNNGVMREAQSRVITNLKDKGQGAFADGLTGKDSSKDAVAGGLTGVSNAYAKNKGILDRRKSSVDASGVVTFSTDSDGKPQYEKDPRKVYDMVINEGNVDALKDYKSWKVFPAEYRKECIRILTDIKNGVITEGIPTTPNVSLINAALTGLGSSASSRVTGDTP
jgi:hypothetical protein